jgi:dihydrofolate reductase
MRLSIIVAVSTNGVIGRGNQLPWHLSADMKRFKAVTMGHHLIVGRKTWDSIGRPLPGRRMVIVTRNPAFSAEGVETATSLEAAIELAHGRGDEEAFIGGGAEIYTQALHRADTMYVTRVHIEVEGDAFFPDFDDVAEWRLTDAEHCEPDEKNPLPYSFLTYERIASGGHAIPEEE